MDIATIGGLAIALVAIVVSVLMDGGSLGALVHVSSFILIVGGTVGATAVGFRMPDIKKLPAAIGAAFRAKKEDPQELIERLVTMAERARREGLLALQDDVRSIDDPLLSRGLQLIVDGTDPEIVKTTMETQVEITEHKQMNLAEILSAAGGYSPTMGIIGTVIGLVQVLKNLDGDFAGAIAMAFLATFYGVFLANILWLPLANKVRQNVAHEALIGRMYIAGVTGLQTGEAPRALREKLEVFLSDVGGKGTQQRRRGGD